MAGGLLLWMANPPIGLGVLGLLAVAPLVALARELADAGAGSWRTFAWGVLAGLVAFLPMLYWLIPFGYVPYLLLSSIQALFVGLYVLLLRGWGERRGRAAIAVVAWVGIEVLRGGWPLGGFGWGVLAYTQADGGLLLGAARTVGTYGLSALLVTIAVAVEEIVRGVLRELPTARATSVPADAVFARIRTPLLTVVGTLVLGVLIAAEPPPTTGRTIDVGIAQAGETRYSSAAGVNRIDDERIEAVADLMVEATRPFAENPPDLLVWPENSLDRDVRTERGAAVRERLDAALALISPAPILAGETAVGPRPGTLHNQMTVFTADGPQQSYVKRRPVPFGEYVPARGLLEWFPPLEQIPNDVLAAEGPQLIDVVGGRIGGVICFENTFPSLAIDQVRAGAEVLVVSTNNSSFGDTPMSRQHVAFSRVRAVETGRWIVHAGISGISAFVDPDGGVHQQTALFEPAAPRMEVPLVDEETVAVRVSGALAAVSLLGLLLIAAAVGYFLAYRRL